MLYTDKNILNKMKSLTIMFLTYFIISSLAIFTSLSLKKDMKTKGIPHRAPTLPTGDPVLLHVEEHKAEDHSEIKKQNGLLTRAIYI